MKKDYEKIHAEKVVFNWSYKNEKDVMESMNEAAGRFASRIALAAGIPLFCIFFAVLVRTVCKSALVQGASVLAPPYMARLFAGIFLVLLALFIFLGALQKKMAARLVKHMLEKPVSGKGACYSSIVRAALGRSREILVPASRENDENIRFQNESRKVLINDDAALYFGPDEYKALEGALDRGVLVSFDEPSFGNPLYFFLGLDGKAEETAGNDL